ncbi:MAG TPA: hypothetical protein VFE05_17390 [Longimicrobiaceae bacterium]|jgi:hypothetical protein|nr:hypothetical protein [Longimicrobiaceae bacterium]
MPKASSARKRAAAEDLPANVVFERDIRLDAKKRATLTGAEFEHYHMMVQNDGTIVLEPRVLARPATVAPRTLAMMDESVANLEKGSVGGAIDFARYRGLLDADEE